MAEDGKNSNTYFPWSCFYAGFILSLISIHFFGAKNSYRVREISIGFLILIMMCIALLKAFKIFDVADPKYKITRPWWWKLLFQVTNLVTGHALGFVTLTFIGQLLN